MPQYPRRKSVVWTRRVIFLSIVGGLVWGIVAIVTGIFGWINGLVHPSQPTMVAGDTCQSQQIRVEANVGTADQKYQGAFNPGEYPYFWFTVTNTGPVACKFNVGSTVTHYWITSGSDNIWDSRDCKLSSAREDYNTELAPATPVIAPASPWERVRSSNAGCSTADGGEIVASDGATYKLHAEVNGVISANEVPLVLN